MGYSKRGDEYESREALKRALELVDKMNQENERLQNLIIKLKFQLEQTETRCMNRLLNVQIEFKEKAEAIKADIQKIVNDAIILLQ